ncbi:MAG: response regulator [Haloferacaceae archaeon]
MSGQTPTVLIVEDEPELANIYAHQLDDEYEVLTATSGREALDLLDDVGAVDVALLDRRMPNLTGDEVLAEMRDRGHDSRVAMVTAVDPDVDVLEMPFDAYLTKPVTGGDLHETVERLRLLDDYDETVRERFALAEKRAALESAHDPEELADSEEYRRLCERLDDAERRAGETAENLDHETFRAALSDL